MNPWRDSDFYRPVYTGEWWSWQPTRKLMFGEPIPNPMFLQGRHSAFRHQPRRSEMQVSAAEKAMEAVSGLFTLPPELRNEIYTLILQQPRTISVSLVKNAPKLLSHSKNIMALTRVSRQIRSESLRLFYAINRFSLHTDIFDHAQVVADNDDVYWHRVTWIHEWLNAIGNAQAKAISKITVQLGSLTGMPVEDHTLATLIDLGEYLGKLALHCLTMGIKCETRFEILGIVDFSEDSYVELAPFCVVEITIVGNQDQVDKAKAASDATQKAFEWLFDRQVMWRDTCIDVLFDGIRQEMLDSLGLK